MSGGENSGQDFLVALDPHSELQSSSSSTSSSSTLTTYTSAALEISPLVPYVAVGKELQGLRKDVFKLYQNLSIRRVVLSMQPQDVSCERDQSVITEPVAIASALTHNDFEQNVGGDNGGHTERINQDGLADDSVSFSASFPTTTISSSHEQTQTHAKNPNFSSSEPEITPRNDTSAADISVPAEASLRSSLSSFEGLEDRQCMQVSTDISCTGCIPLFFPIKLIVNYNPRQKILGDQT